MLEALGAGTKLTWYARCREAGVCHTDAIEAQMAGADLDPYVDCRKAGATHAEVLEAHGAGADLFWYTNCLLAGAAHQEAMAIRLREFPAQSITQLALYALRAACGTTPTRELGETIATLAQDWAGTANELGATAVALAAPRPS